MKSNLFFTINADDSLNATEHYLQKSIAKKQLLHHLEWIICGIISLLLLLFHCFVLLASPQKKYLPLSSRSAINKIFNLRMASKHGSLRSAIYSYTCEAEQWDINSYVVEWDNKIFYMTTESKVELSEQRKKNYSFHMCALSALFLFLCNATKRDDKWMERNLIKTICNETWDGWRCTSDSSGRFFFSTYISFLPSLRWNILMIFLCLCRSSRRENARLASGTTKVLLRVR